VFRYHDELLASILAEHLAPEGERAMRSRRRLGVPVVLVWIGSRRTDDN